MADSKEIISLKDVAHIATLARLELNAEELAEARVQLGGILNYMKELDALDVSNVSPTVEVLVSEAALRRDSMGVCLQRDEVLAQAPASAAGGVLVPRVLEIDE